MALFVFTGYLNMWRLHAMLQKARLLAYHVPCKHGNETFLDYDKVMEKAYTFTASVKTNIERDYYRIHEKVLPLSLRVSICLSHVGKTSMSTTATLNCSDSGEVFVNSVNQSVIVDRATHRPISLPGWWKDKYARAIIENRSTLVPLMDAPTDSHIYEMKVPWSDIDQYGHANHVAYIRYCYNCAVDGILNGLYLTHKDSAMLHRVSEMHMRYCNECVGNDILNIASWEDDENPSILRFAIKLRMENKFQSSIKFHQAA